MIHIICVLWSHSCLSVGVALVARSFCMKCKWPLNQREQSVGSKEGESGGLGQCGFGRCVAEVWGNWVSGLDIEDEMGTGWCGKGVGSWDFRVEPCRQEAGYAQRGLGWDGKGIISSCWAPETIC